MKRHVRNVLGTVRQASALVTPLDRTLAVIRYRWNSIDEKKIPMLFTGHVKRDIQVLLTHIDTLQKEIDGMNDDAAGASL